MGGRLSQNQGKLGGAGLKCPPEHRAAGDGRPTGIQAIGRAVHAIGGGHGPPYKFIVLH